MSPNTMNSAVALFSGGLDSAVTLALLRDRHPECQIYPLFIDIGATASKTEFTFSRKFLSHYDLRPKKVTCYLDFLFDSHDMLRDDTVICFKPGGLSPGERKDHVIPFRNFIMLSIALSYAGYRGADQLWVGFDFENRDINSLDKCPEFVAAFQNAIKEGGEAHEQIDIVCPLLNHPKRWIYEQGQRLNIPFQHTFSCYNGFRKACGVCGRCVDRAVHFPEWLGMEDPAGFITREHLIRQLGKEYAEKEIHESGTRAFD